MAREGPAHIRAGRRALIRLPMARLQPAVHKRERKRAGGGGREYHQDGTVRERARERVKGRERERKVGDKIF